MPDDRGTESGREAVDLVEAVAACGIAEEIPDAASIFVASDTGVLVPGAAEDKDGLALVAAPDFLTSLTAVVTAGVLPDLASEAPLVAAVVASGTADLSSDVAPVVDARFKITFTDAADLSFACLAREAVVATSAAFETIEGAASGAGKSAVFAGNTLDMPIMADSNNSAGFRFIRNSSYSSPASNAKFFRELSIYIEEERASQM